MKIDWRKFWHEFDVWHHKQEEQEQLGRRYCTWLSQKRKIGSMLMEYFPKLNRRKLWKDWENRWEQAPLGKVAELRLVDWSGQKRWIRELVQKQCDE